MKKEIAENAMGWTQEFYHLQNEWLNVYLGKVDDFHREQARMVQQLIPLQAPYSILELGAGGGQTAVALAELGHKMSVVEIQDASVANARKISSHLLDNPLQIYQADFYKVELPGNYDVVCYFDSFGIGTDQDQKRLLKRIYDWLKPDGFALIEVGTPWYWAQNKGQSIDFGEYKRVYDFDPIECRLLDFWSPKDAPEKTVHQRLRCYSPADLALLLSNVGLHIQHIEPGGKMIYETMEWVDKAPLEEAMTYHAVLRK